MRILDKNSSKDNKTIKFLQLTEDNILTETAFIEEDDRFIICFASQLGCSIGCRFCYNGIYKNYYRNLSELEIIEECKNVVKELKLEEKNKPILFSCMGVGEPLLNYNNVINAINKLNELYPGNKFALATTGIKPELISKLSDDLKDIKNFKLTISLHASNEDLRRKIIPIDVSFKKIKKEITKFKNNSNHTFEWNYVLLDNVNDNKNNIYELLEFVDKDDLVKISYFNEIEGCIFKKSHNVKQVINILKNNNVNYKTFKSSGVDIEVGCGQMVTTYNKKIKRR